MVSWYVYDKYPHCNYIFIFSYGQIEHYWTLLIAQQISKGTDYNQDTYFSDSLRSPTVWPVGNSVWTYWYDGVKCLQQNITWRPLYVLPMTGIMFFMLSAVIVGMKPLMKPLISDVVSMVYYIYSFISFSYTKYFVHSYTVDLVFTLT